MLTPELLAQIRRLDVRSRRLALERFAGEYRSAFKGAGLAFAEVRPYTPGDEIRTIDWNVTARMGQPYIKCFHEERQRTLLFLVDVSGSTSVGSQQRTKQELAAEITAVLAWSAAQNHDKTGLLLFSDRVEQFLAPGAGRKHGLRLLQTLLTAQAQGQGTDVRLALEAARGWLKQRAIVFILSDFIVDPASYRAALANLNRRHDVAALEIRDPLEQSMPATGLLQVEDAETGRRLWVDTRSPDWQRVFAARAAAWEQARRQVFRETAVDYLPILTTDDYIPALARFFAGRTRQAG